jgi:hypothetical protein
MVLAETQYLTVLATRERQNIKYKDGRYAGLRGCLDDVNRLVSAETESTVNSSADHNKIHLTEVSNILIRPSVY